ncbi:beta-mannosidase [Labilibaculum filiforme]|uniref:Mannan endo-1,4-beta-mannosidase n=2 Tax=Labilibaculum filiforme TaxID=1940526 RepID=A0A2N3I4F4_9BACT|nr:beta-mannosidase [Labilibaculum filiforme]
MIRAKITVVLGLAVLMACCQKPVEKSTNPIAEQLESVKGKGILFGHQDDLAYGMNWSYVDGESDVKRVAGDYPAMFGWELGGVELKNTHDLDSIPFQVMKDLVVKGYEMGGVNTFSWHPFSVINGENAWNTETDVVKHILQNGSHHKEFLVQLDRVADFLQSLKTGDGEVVPFIFRPWHEMDGTWFWWGAKNCTPDEFKELFRFSVDYLKNKKGLSQMLVAYSPDRNFTSLEEYLTWYPGDDVVDIIGMDNYYDLKMPDGEKEAIKKLHILIAYAKEKQKFSALTETGLENVTDSLWFTQKLGKVVSDSLVSKELSYVMVWRNDPKVHFFFPYENHSAATDAKSFLDQPEMLLLNDFNKLKKINN